MSPKPLPPDVLDALVSALADAVVAEVLDSRPDLLYSTSDGGPDEAANGREARPSAVADAGQAGEQHGRDGDEHHPAPSPSLAGEAGGPTAELDARRGGPRRARGVARGRRRDVL